MAWSPVAQEFAYVTDASGEQEIRVQNSQTHREHVAVSRRKFPGVPVIGFQNPGFLAGWNAPGVPMRASTQLSSIWISPLRGACRRRLTAEGVYAQSPTWSPDGNWIAHLELRDGRVSLVRTRLGSNQPGILIVPRGCNADPLLVACR